MFEERDECDEHSFRRVARLLYYGKTREEIRKSFKGMTNEEFFLVWVAGNLILKWENDG